MLRVWENRGLFGPGRKGVTGDCSVDRFTFCAGAKYCATDRTKEVDIGLGGREEYVQDFGGKREGKRAGRGWV
jgi:hypothetical protein